ncbi:MAG: prepilin peptidase [Oligoflexia bacterium]|nr:prepilin peptidase [Oligoflexia bacterium]
MIPLEVSLWPQWFLNAASLLIGLTVGSFLNVVVARLPHDQSVVRPRSRCPGCGKLIVWYDNVPLVSFLLLRGRCRHCSMKISWRYPMIELTTGLLFLAAMVQFGPSPALVLRDWPFLAVLVAVTFIDLEHRIIPDELSLGGLVLGLATCWFDPRLVWYQAVLGAALGFGLFYGLAWAYEKYSGRSGLGGGDIKLLAMIGAFLGPSGVLATILVSSVSGSLVGIGWALAQKQKQIMTAAIPYGPFLVIGGLYYYLFGPTWPFDALWLLSTNPT